MRIKFLIAWKGPRPACASSLILPRRDSEASVALGGVRRRESGMNIYFTFRSMPEMASVPKANQEALWQRCHSKAWRHWQTWLALFLCIGTQVAGFYVAGFAIPDSPFFWRRIVLGGLFVVAGAGAFSPVHIAMTRPYIRRQLGK